MDFFVACFAFPAAIIVLSGGIGLIVDRAAGRSLPGPLVLPVGFAGAIVLTQLLTRKDGISDLTPYVVLVVGLVGLVLGRKRLRDLRGAVEPALAFLGAYGIAIAPLLFLGRVSILAYLRDTTPGTHLAGAYGLIDHGASFAWAPPTSDGNQLRAYFDNAYPSGGHTVLGGVGRLFSTDLMWLFQPYLAICLAMGAPALWLLARRLGLGRALTLVAAVVACVPAITYAYALQGSIKELTLIPTLSALPTFLVSREHWLSWRVRGLLPLAVLGGGAIGAIGVAAGPWVLLAFLVAIAVLMIDAQGRGFPPRSVVAPVLVLGGAFAVLILPVLLHLASSIGVARSFAQSNAAAANDPGNLLAPLHAVQAFGVWIAGDQRLPPPVRSTETYALIGVVMGAVALGAAELWRRRAWTVWFWLAGTCVIWWALTKRGTIWTDAKLLVLIAPLMVFVAFVGASSLRVVSRLAAWGVAAAIAIGVLWSDAILYHETNPIPTQRYREALALDKQFAGRGPAFTPDFDEYMFTAFRRTHVDGVGFAYDPPWVTVKGGGQVPYGNPVDLDSVELSSLERTPLIIARTSPEQSRPPSNFRLVHDGLSWRVWERSGPAPLQHLGVLGNGDPSGVAPCSALRRLGAAATRAGTHLVAAERPSIIIDGFTDAQLSPRWPRAGDGGVIVAGAGRLTTSVRIPHGDTWRIWLRGDVDRPLTIAVDNRVVGTVGYQSGGIGNYILPVRATLTPGRHVVSLYRGGGSLHPGDGNNTIVRRMVLEPAADREQLVDIAADRWHELCGRKLDWIEVASPGTGSRSATS